MISTIAHYAARFQYFFLTRWNDGFTGYDPNVRFRSLKWSGSFRHDVGRSGHVNFVIPLNLKSLWDAELNGRLTSPVRAAVLMAVDIEDGHERGRLALDTQPVFDGMAAAQGRLYISAIDGKVVCLGED